MYKRSNISAQHKSAPENSSVCGKEKYWFPCSLNGRNVLTKHSEAQVGSIFACPSSHLSLHLLCLYHLCCDLHRCSRIHLLDTLILHSNKQSLFTEPLQVDVFYCVCLQRGVYGLNCNLKLEILTHETHRKVVPSLAFTT